MIVIKVQYGDAFFKKTEKRLETASSQFALYVAPTLLDIQAGALEVLQNYPTPQSPLPFIWSFDPVAQARARRWWFANLRAKGRLGVGGRYKRTGALGRNWQTVTAYSQSGERVRLEIKATNVARGASYVYGAKQVPSHKATGWPLTPQLADQIATQVRPVQKVADAWVDFWLKGS